MPQGVLNFSVEGTKESLTSNVGTILFGEGILRIKGKTKSYHSITALSMGFHMGIQNYALIIIAFTSNKALQDFILDEDDWETDVDTKIVMAEWTTDDVDEKDFGTSMVGFAFDSTGMMGKFSMEGIKLNIFILIISPIGNA